MNLPVSLTYWTVLLLIEMHYVVWVKIGSLIIEDVCYSLSISAVILIYNVRHVVHTCNINDHTCTLINLAFVLTKKKILWVWNSPSDQKNRNRQDRLQSLQMWYLYKMYINSKVISDINVYMLMYIYYTDDYSNLNLQVSLHFLEMSTSVGDFMKN